MQRWSPTRALNEAVRLRLAGQQPALSPTLLVAFSSGRTRHGAGVPSKQMAAADRAAHYPRLPRRPRSHPQTRSRVPCTHFSVRLSRQRLRQDGACGRGLAIRFARSYPPRARAARATLHAATVPSRTKVQLVDVCSTPLQPGAVRREANFARKIAATTCKTTGHRLAPHSAAARPRK